MRERIERFAQLRRQAAHLESDLAQREIDIDANGFSPLRLSASPPIELIERAKGDHVDVNGPLDAMRDLRRRDDDDDPVLDAASVTQMFLLFVRSLGPPHER